MSDPVVAVAEIEEVKPNCIVEKKLETALPSQLTESGPDNDDGRVIDKEDDKDLIDLDEYEVIDFDSDDDQSTNKEQQELDEKTDTVSETVENDESALKHHVVNEKCGDDSAIKWNQYTQAELVRKEDAEANTNTLLVKWNQHTQTELIQKENAETNTDTIPVKEKRIQVAVQTQDKSVDNKKVDSNQKNVMKSSNNTGKKKKQQDKSKENTDLPDGLSIEIVLSFFALSIVMISLFFANFSHV